MESSEVFVGRDAALALLRDAWADAAASRPRVVCVIGRAGMGKTTLARRFVTEHAADRARWAAADEGPAQQPFALVTRLLHMLGADAPDAPPAALADELEAGAALLQALGTPTRPYAVVVDDVQWADSPSQAALRFALRRLEAEPVLVILALRGESPASLDEPTRRLLADPRVAPCIVDGLAAAEIIDLADRMGAGRIDAATAERLREHTGGLPLHTVALLAERGDDLDGFGRVLPAPRSFTRVVHDRLQSTAPAARDLVSAGAVLGRAFSVATAGRLVRLADTGAARQEAVTLGLVDADGDTATFRHPLVRAAVYRDLAPARRRDLHAAAAEATAGVDSLLHRVDAADGVDDSLADELATAAADASGTTGGELLLAAARCTSPGARRDERTVAAAVAFLQQGAPTRAHALRPELDAAPATMQREVALALLDVDDGRFAAARDRCTAALADPGDAAPESVAEAHAALALARWAEGDFAGAVDDATIALRGDIGALTARCCYLRIVSLEVLGRLGELPPDHLPATLGTTDRLALDGITRYHRNDIPGAIASLEGAVGRSRSGHPTELFIIVLGMLADALFREGRWNDAALHAELAVSLARDTDAYGEQLLAHAAAAEIQSARGRSDAAAGHLDSIRRFAAAMPTWPTMTRLGMTEALVAIATDDRDALVAAERTLCAEPGRSEVTRRPAVPWRALVAEAQLASGRLDEASGTIEELTAAAHATQQQRAVPDIRRLTGWLAEAQGRLDDALAAYRISEADAAAAHAPLAVARLTFARGLLLLRRGDAAGGRATLMRARAAFARLGADPFLRRCEQAMDAADRASLAAMPLLSPRQEAVALLVAEHLSNREIAHRLYVGVKTVEYHLGQIYARTGLSRQELGARIRESPTWRVRRHIADAG